MIKCINSRRLKRAESFEGLCRQAVEGGFGGLEIAVGRGELVTIEMLEEGGDEILSTVRKHTLKLPAIAGQDSDRVKSDQCLHSHPSPNTNPYTLKLRSLTSSDYDLFSLAGAGGGRVEDALEHFGSLLQYARRCDGGTMVTIGANVVKPVEEVWIDSYEETFNQLYKSLEKLAIDAETSQAQLALENPGRGVLLSPLELRDMIDEVNSPYLGISFNPQNAQRLGEPLDWCAILGQRIKALRLSYVKSDKGKYLEQLEEGLKPTLNVINKQGWDGPVIYFGTEYDDEH